MRGIKRGVELCTQADGLLFATTKIGTDTLVIGGFLARDAYVAKLVEREAAKLAGEG